MGVAPPPLNNNLKGGELDKTPPDKLIQNATGYAHAHSRMLRVPLNNRLRYRKHPIHH